MSAIERFNGGRLSRPERQARQEAERKTAQVRVDAAEKAEQDLVDHIQKLRKQYYAGVRAENAGRVTRVTVEAMRSQIPPDDELVAGYMLGYMERAASVIRDQI
jgi:hypothetical protein